MTERQGEGFGWAIRSPAWQRWWLPSASPASRSFSSRWQPAPLGDTPRGAAQMRASQRRSEAQAQPQSSSMRAAALIVLGRAGILRARGNAALFRWGIWFLAVAMAIGALPNFASQSRWENLIFGPLALVLAILCVIVARRAATGQSSDTQRIERG